MTIDDRDSEPARLDRIDALFPAVCEGDRDAFEAWLVEVETPLRKHLSSWARAVDVESVAQEALLRMWVFAQDRGHELDGERASLRWLVGIAVNVARNEARRFRHEHLVPSDELPESPIEPEPPPDPFLDQLIRRCIEEVSDKPRRALEARVASAGAIADRELARTLGMKLNTFLKNIGRARKQVAACLRKSGAPLEELMP